MEYRSACNNPSRTDHVIRPLCDELAAICPCGRRSTPRVAPTRRGSSKGFFGRCLNECPGGKATDSRSGSPHPADKKPAGRQPISEPPDRQTRARPPVFRSNDRKTGFPASEERHV